MPPLPKKKHSKSRLGRRRSHLGLSPLHLVDCPQCHKPRLPHRVCPFCGHYRGRAALPMEEPRR